MARWKALYLINGYDSVWQLIRRLQDLVKPYVPSQELTQVPPVLYLDDGTIADGNWSARELCSVLQMPTGVYGGFSLNVFYYWGQVGGPGFAAYSVNRLLHFLDAISGLPLQGSSEWLDLNAGRPLSFRALLAACDDESYSLPLTAGG